MGLSIHQWRPRHSHPHPRAILLTALSSAPFSVQKENEAQSSQLIDKQDLLLCCVVASLPPLRTVLPASGRMCVKVTNSGFYFIFRLRQTLTLFSPCPCAGSELFTGLYSDYWGRDSAIFRSLGKLGHIRTEHDDERLLKGRDEQARAWKTRVESNPTVRG